MAQNQSLWYTSCILITEDTNLLPSWTCSPYKSLRILTLAAVCGSMAHAGSVLYWIDATAGGTNVVPGAITLAGDTGTAAASDTDFDTLLNDGGWSAVIIGLGSSNLGAYDANILPDLTTYVNGGGLLIGADWSNADSGLFNLFDASPVDSNDTSITNDSNPLFNGISGDINLTNPGYGTYDQSYSALAGGTGVGPSGGGYGIIVGNGGLTFLDGPLFDTYSDPTQGEQLVANELGAQSGVPEPGTLSMLLGGLSCIAFGAARKRKTR